MARWPSVVLLLLPTLIPTAVAKTTLSSELTNLLPSCAHECFTNFLDFNFALTKCGINPTLDCLCTTKSVSAYTVGEGAVQCVLSVAECGNVKNRDAAAFKAYTMCDGKKDALPNTHATLTATMVVESSTTTPTPSRSTSRSNFSASSVLTASTTLSSLAPSTLLTATETTPRLTTTSPNTAIPSPTTSTTATADSSLESPLPAPQGLTRNQTIGISVGSSVGALILIGLIIFACIRRRQYQRRSERDSDMLPFQMDPSNHLNYSHGFHTPPEKKIRGPGPTSNGIAGKFPPRIPVRIDTSSPNMFSRRSLGLGMGVKPDMIGVAISPDNNKPSFALANAAKTTPTKNQTAMTQRHPSPLLPGKPSLTLTMPSDEKITSLIKNSTSKQTGQNTNNNGLSAPQANIRQSTATQFEEDFDSADTAVAADDSWMAVAPGAGSQVPPGTTIRQVAPEPTLPVPAFFVTGANGRDWKPNTAVNMKANANTQQQQSQAAQGEYQIKPLNLTRQNGAMGSFSQPRRPEEYTTNLANIPSQQPQSQGPPPPSQGSVMPQRAPNLSINVPLSKSTTRNATERPITNGSSIYTSRSSAPPSSVPSLPGDNNNYNGNQGMYNNNGHGGNRRSSYRQQGPYDNMPRHQSSGSQTSFETVDSASGYVDPRDTWGTGQFQGEKKQAGSQRPVLAPLNTNTSVKSSNSQLQQQQSTKSDLKNRESRRTIMLDLSPVVESPNPSPIPNAITNLTPTRSTNNNNRNSKSPVSPSSPVGVSPVSYPKIPSSKAGRLTDHTIRMVPPPAQPDFMSVFSSGPRPQQQQGGAGVAQQQQRGYVQSQGQQGRGQYPNQNQNQYQNQNRGLVNRDGVSPEEVAPVSPLTGGNSPTPIDLDTATGITPTREASMKPWRVAEIRAQREREREQRERERGSVQISIGMVSPELPESRGEQQKQQSAPQTLPRQGQRIQPFRLGKEQISGPQSQGGNQVVMMGPPPPRIQPQLLPQQRRLQQEQQGKGYQPPVATKQLKTSQSLQQQLNTSYQAFDPSIHGRSQQRSSTAPLPPVQGTSTNTERGRLLNPNPTFVLTHTRSSSVSSTTSSLLAKRRGGDGSSLALNLVNRPQQAQVERRNSQKWRVLDEQGKEKAKNENWRPMAGNGNGNGNVNNNGAGAQGQGQQQGTQWVEYSYEAQQTLGSGGLPRTPGWVPKLTPTRRGDELFLSVA